MTRAVPITEPRFTLAEGPVWDAARQRVLWVDIPEGLVLAGRLNGDSLQIESEHRFDAYVSSVAVGADGSLLVAETRHLTEMAPDGTRLMGAELAIGDHDRLNDGVCDARGRFLVGTLSLLGVRHSQRLMQVGPGGVAVLDDDLGLANGLAFSPDDSILYSVDTVPGAVWARTYDQESGAVGPRKLLLDLDDGLPDGLAIDVSGNLWLAIWGRGEVRCYSRSGQLLDVITLPAPHTSSVAFVGPDLDQLLITTARDELEAADLAAYPLSGSLFLAKPGAIGLAPHPTTGLPSAGMPDPEPHHVGDRP